MRRQDKLIISFVLVFMVGWGVYEYRDYMRLRKEAATEFGELQRQAFEKMSKPKGNLGFEGKNKIHVELRITNSSNDITKWVVLRPGGVSASFGSYDAGEVTIELMRKGEVVDKLVFELLEGGRADFEIYGDRIEGTSNNSEYSRLDARIQAIKEKSARNSWLLRRFTTQRAWI